MSGIEVWGRGRLLERARWKAEEVAELIRWRERLGWEQFPVMADEVIVRLATEAGSLAREAGVR